MKLLILGSLNSHAGKLAPFITEQAEALRAVGCEVEYFGVVGKGVWGYLKQLPKLRRMVHEQHIDIIHAHYGLCCLLANQQHRVPLIFTIPFPTMVKVDSQENQMMIHGGNYVKNILSFFTIFAILLLVLSGGWRKHVFPLAFMLGYLLVLVFSNFAQSERFHMPVLSIELMFVAMAIFTVGNRHKYRHWFNYWTILIVIANIGWAYIKLKGRGL